MSRIEKEMQDRAIDFEKRFGTDLFIKTLLGTFSMILVDKGICTKEEICQLFDEHIFDIEREYRKYQESEESGEEDEGEIEK